MKLVPTKTLQRIWQALPPQLGSVVGEKATLAAPELAREWAPTGKRYYAELELVEPRMGKLWMSFALPLAIASAGHLVMRPKNAIQSNIASSTFDGDDFDAMGECVNTFCAALNDAVRAELGEGHRIVFRTGSLEVPDAGALGPLVVARGQLELGELTSGEIELVVPEAVFAVATEKDVSSDEDDDEDDEDDEHDEDDDDEQGAATDGERDEPRAAKKPKKKKTAKKKRRESAPMRDAEADPDDADGGALLSREELEAIREATSTRSKGVAVIVADRTSARELWRGSLEPTGVEFELVANHHQALAICRARNVDVVVIDADACPSGGLSLLAAIRGGVGVPARRVVVASSATHSHLVSCFAGGASDYVVRPLDDAALARVLESA